MQVTGKQGQWPGDIAVREAGSINSIYPATEPDDGSFGGIGYMAVETTFTVS
jgi:hypothetical protein